jgi:replicative DNA helicase
MTVVRQLAGPGSVPPPEDPEAERALLGSILLGGHETFIVAHALVEANDLTRHEHRMVMAAIEEIAERGEAIDYASVAGEMRRLNPHGANAEEARSYAQQLVGMIQEVPTSLNAETYAKRVRYCATARRIITTASEIGGIAYSGRHGTDAGLMEAVQTKVEELLMAQGGGGQILSQKDLAFMYTDILERRQKRDPQVIGYPTGYSRMDDYVRFRLGEFVLLAASPGVGKTSLITNLQDDLAMRGIPSLFATAEQPPMQLMDRAVASQGDLDGWHLSQGKLDTGEWEKVTQVLAGRFNMPAYLYYDPAMTTARLAAQVQLAKVRHGIKVVFVDYLQLLADESSENDYQRVSQIGRRLKYMAGTYMVNVVAACQVRRDKARKEGEPPALEDLRGSGTLEQEADTVVCIGRKQGENVTKLAVRKNRNAPTGEFSLYFQPAQTRFLSLQEDVPA